MNVRIYNLLLKILDSRLSPQTQEEIVKFYMLPRNTPIKPVIETYEDEDDLGPVKRPSRHDLDRKQNPSMADEEDEMKKTFDKINTQH